MSQFWHYDPAVEEVHTALQLAVSSGAVPELIQKLESALELVKLRDDFARNTTSEESQVLKDIVEETNRHDWLKVYEEGKTTWNLSPRMLSGRLEGQFLKSLVSIQKAKRVLEIGLYTGYSALAMAEALPADGEVVSIDVQEYLRPLVTDLIKKSPHGKKITIVIGTTLDILKDMTARGERFDFIFLDADTSDYLAYFKFIFEDGLLSSGGTVAIDNAFRHGRAYIPSNEDIPTKKYTSAIASDPSLHKVLVPIRDGVLLVRRLADVEGGVK